MTQIAEQRATGSSVKPLWGDSLAPGLRQYRGMEGRIVGVVDDEAGLRYAVQFKDGQIVYFTDEQLA